MQEDAPVAGGLATRVPMPAKAVYELLPALLARSSAGLERFLAGSCSQWGLTLNGPAGRRHRVPHLNPCSPLGRPPQGLDPAGRMTRKSARREGESTRRRNREPPTLVQGRENRRGPS